MNTGGKKRLWLALLAAAVIIAATSIVGALGGREDRGVRGPADQGAPAPHDDKVPPSAKP